MSDLQMTTTTPTLTATYRLQLNKDFNFAMAEALVPYLAELGISHLYLSPILMAQPGSTHGYDTVNHSRINPELGTLAEFRTLVGSARAHRLGIIVDFVPNHMGVGGDKNLVWLDVLEHGPDSAHADWFDIDWQWPGAEGKLLVPFLGADYGQALSNGDIVLKAEDGALAVWAYDQHKLPLKPETSAALVQQFGEVDRAVAAINGSAGQPDSWNALDEIIGQQHWRLAHFRVAADEINYRRFFINSDLAGIRIDRPAVFEHAHSLIFQLIGDGLIDGLRIDHVDGLLDPKGYLDRLRQVAPRPILVFIEKILAPHEALRADWPTEGTTGYEFGAQLTRLFIEPTSEAAVSQAYVDLTGNAVDPETEAYRAKLRVMDNELAAELASVARQIARLAHSVRATRDLPENTLRKALREIIACLTVYRPYVDDAGIDSRDQRNLRYAIAKARRLRIDYPTEVMDFLQGLLTLQLPANYPHGEVLAVIGRVQQLTGPVMAKGLEDTALYRYNRLVALNEVGAHPERYCVDVAAFHDANNSRLRSHPHGLLATTTHDTKRGEDTRARISAISYEPGLWESFAGKWLDRMDRSLDRNDGYLLLQLLLGGWPLDDTELSTQGVDELSERLQAAMVKSIREARLHSDWGVANTEYEDRTKAAIGALLKDREFLTEFAALNAALAPIGRRIALSQLLLKLTVPGTPDIYRGAESWEQSFVDPDNRRPVAFDGLKARLEATGKAGDRKLELTQTLLQARRLHPDLFVKGNYEPMEAENGTIAFRRRFGSDVLVVAINLHADAAPAFPNPAPEGTSFLEIVEPFAVVRGYSAL